MKRIVVFDLDETVIDSRHRTPNRPDGTLDLQRYFELKNRETIFQDTLLPLARIFKALDRAHNLIVICTARAMNQDDFDFLAAHGLDSHMVMCRPLDGSENHIRDADLKAQKLTKLRDELGLPIVMFDDASPVIRGLRQAGIVTLNAHKVNRRLAA